MPGKLSAAITTLAAALVFCCSTLPAAQAQLAPTCATNQLSCSGLVGPSICCDKSNFRCDVRGTGEARCAACPTQCTQCLPGTVCAVDHNGCYNCLQPCSDAEPCNLLQVCAPVHVSLPGTYCRTHPCSAWADPCAAVGMRCELTSTYEPHCVPGEVQAPGCSAEHPCDSGKVCVGGTCQADPCTALSCPSDTPTCKIGTAGVPRCIKECSEQAPCQQDQQCVAGECQGNACATMTCPAHRPSCILGGSGVPHCVPACSTEMPCPSGRICVAGNCKIHPCTGLTCPANRPTCVLAGDGSTAACTTACTSDSSCTGQEMCLGGACRTHPCQAAPCPASTRCLIGHDYTARCVQVLGDTGGSGSGAGTGSGALSGGSTCNPPCKGTASSCRQLNGSWRCISKVAPTTINPASGCVPPCGTGRTCRKVGTSWRCMRAPQLARRPSRKKNRRTKRGLL